MRVRTERHWAILILLAMTVACGGPSGPDEGTSGELDAANANGKKAGRTFTVSGTLSGLTSTLALADALVLQDNGGDALALTDNGPFTFATRLKNHSSYAVTVYKQPTGYTCAVDPTTASGTITGSNVTDVAVSCTPNPAPTAYYTVGGTISGLSGTVTLQNNGGDNLTLSTNGSFTFATALADGSSYTVTVATQPSGQTCGFGPNGTDTSAAGTISGANVSVTVTCSPTSSPPRVATPTFSPAPGTYEATDCGTWSGSCFTVTITDDTPGAVIYYTVDGSVPSVSGGVPAGSTRLYDGPIQFFFPWDIGCGSDTVTIAAIGIVNGVTSDVAYATYTVWWCSLLS